MAISARFSSHSSIHMSSPYLAEEEFVKKALSLVDNNMLRPTVANIQFWGIMSCVEYGRASGSMSWIYADIAIRLCRELGYHKEEILSTVIHTEDGSIDAVAMAMRRRMFWSCFILDKYVTVTSAGTHRIQCVGQADYDAHIITLAEIILLKEPDCHTDIYGYPIHEDSLLNITKHYIACIEKFGQVNRWMNKMSNHRQNDKALLPSIAEYRNLDMQLCSWQESLPEKFHFTEGNLKYHQKFAGIQHLAVWLNCHVMWCCSMIILHRGSLAYTNAVYYATAMTDELKTKIQRGLETCYKCADTAIDIFGVMKDVCGHNMVPYIGYLAYVLATFLMASAFSDIDKDGEKCQKGAFTILVEFNRSQTNDQSQQMPKTTFFSQDLPSSTTPYNQHDHYFAQERLHNAQVVHDHLKSTEPDYFKNIIFNNSGFLYDAELFGHLVLGSSRIQTAPYLQVSQSKC
ncbi:hypothetical protein G6F46_010329 [Rhizopus delemar]|nr:hypothetical protein G6F54_009903 [Rhizopus delemar]KAG1505523.1 hypothetical protein G6F53_010167 [Rhizopus delemar]KAG1591578.1 hypothetical protein G6F47_009701 [Rhizopus delemar]KAG1610037.1 hypothetical protein G6F46_010329 [Rhizopus delemar]